MRELTFLHKKTRGDLLRCRHETWHLTSAAVLQLCYKHCVHGRGTEEETKCKHGCTRHIIRSPAACVLPPSCSARSSGPAPPSFCSAVVFVKAKLHHVLAGDEVTSAVLNCRVGGRRGNTAIKSNQQAACSSPHAFRRMIVFVCVLARRLARQKGRKKKNS